MKLLFRTISPHVAHVLCLVGFLASTVATSPMNEAPTSRHYRHENESLNYGVDVSFPMHHLPYADTELSEDGDRQPVFRTPLEQFAYQRLQYYHNHFLQGCIDRFGENDCMRAEQERIDMSLHQPATQKNMTNGLGFLKIRMPKTTFQAVLDFWNANKHEAVPEGWQAGSTYVNHWESQPEVVRVDNRTLAGGGDKLTTMVWDTLRPVLAEWTGQHLDEASMYGIRKYTTGSVLATHVDRNPLVTSAIINVDQDMDEPWPLEVVAHDGKAYNVTMEPGDLVLYESHSVLHGRPYPLKGRFMANLFVHFEPVNPNAKLSDLPLYRRPMKQSNKTCIPTLKNGAIVCNFQ